MLSFVCANIPRHILHPQLPQDNTLLSKIMDAHLGGERARDREKWRERGGGNGVFLSVLSGQIM